MILLPSILLSYSVLLRMMNVLCYVQRVNHAIFCLSRYISKSISYVIEFHFYFFSVLTSLYCSSGIRDQPNPDNSVTMLLFLRVRRKEITLPTQVIRATHCQGGTEASIRRSSRQNCSGKSANLHTVGTSGQFSG